MKMIFAGENAIRPYNCIVMICMILFLSFSGYASSSIKQPEDGNLSSMEEYAPFRGFSPVEITLQESISPPVLRGFGDGGGGFDDSGAGENDGGFNDAAPIEDSWLIMVAPSIFYAVWRWSKINRHKRKSNFPYSKNN